MPVDVRDSKVSELSGSMIRRKQLVNLLETYSLDYHDEWRKVEKFLSHEVADNSKVKTASCHVPCIICFFHNTDAICDVFLPPSL